MLWSEERASTMDEEVEETGEYESRDDIRSVPAPSDLEGRR